MFPENKLHGSPVMIVGKDPLKSQHPFLKALLVYPLTLGGTIQIIGKFEQCQLGQIWKFPNWL